MTITAPTGRAGAPWQRLARWRRDGKSPEWRVVRVLAVTQTVCWGVLFYAFSAVLLPMAAELGAGRGLLAGAWSTGLLVSGVAAPFVGAHIDRRGGRDVMTVGAVLGAAGVVWWSTAASLAHLYAAFAVIGLASAMVLYEPAFAVVASVVPPRRRSTALLFITVVAGFAATIFLPLTTALVEWAGWRGAVRWLAGLVLATAVPHAMAIPRKRNADGATTHAVARARTARLAPLLRDGAFWWLTSSFILGTASVTAVSAHMVGFLMDRGETASFAAAAVGSLGAIKVGGRVLLTLAERKTSIALVTAAVFASQGAAFAILAMGAGRVAVLAFVAIYGAGFGAATIARPLLVAEIWGTESYGMIAGAVAFGVTVSKAVAPIAAGVARDATGSATPVLLTLGGVTAVAGLCLLPLARSTREPTAL